MAEPYKAHPAHLTLSKPPPPLPPTSLPAYLRQYGSRLPILIILDDDPTGTQTCHDISVLTTWEIPTLTTHLSHLSTRRSPLPRGVFILTNSRSLPPPAASALITEICTNIQTALSHLPTPAPEVEIILRSDSTLRGHFPLEPQIADSIFGESDAWILAPYFRQGGRVTIDGVHWVLSSETKPGTTNVGSGQGGESEVVEVLTPAAATPFAKDASFGYKNSHLGRYVEEKSGGRIRKEDVVWVGLEQIRGEDGVDRVRDLLVGLERTERRKKVVVVNAVVDSDMEVFVQGALEARRLAGKRFTYRTGAAFVSTRLGIEQIDPIVPEMDFGAGGLVIAGSYVPKTTAQLEALVTGRGEKLMQIVLDVEELLRENEWEVVEKAAERANQEIANKKDVLVMTSRKLATGKDEDSSLEIGSVVAKALVKFLELIKTRPRYIIAKGGITSSDAATKGLKMKQAEVIGQAAPGVPLWECHEETSKFTGIPYIVFPGNVGDNNTLRDLVAKWSSDGR